MYKKTFFVLLISLFLIGSTTFAADNSSVGILPNNPFYFVKEVGRNIQSFLTFNPTKKAELSLEFAEERLKEIEALAEKDPENTDFDKYLEKYQDSLLDFQNKASVLVQNSEESQKLLEKITNNTFSQDARLENLRARIKASNIDEIKNEVVEIYTNSSLELVTPEKIQEQLQNTQEYTNKEQIIDKIIQIAPNISSFIEKIDSVVTEEYLIEKMNTEATNLGISPEEVLNEIKDIPEEDKSKLQSYAVDLLTGNKSAEEIMEDVQEMGLSIQTQEKISNLQEKVSLANPASKKCVDDGYTSKIITEEDGSQYGICISEDGQECDEWDYYNGDCKFE